MTEILVTATIFKIFIIFLQNKMKNSMRLKMPSQTKCGYFTQTIIKFD